MFDAGSEEDGESVECEKCKVGKTSRKEEIYHQMCGMNKIFIPLASSLVMFTN